MPDPSVQKAESEAIAGSETTGVGGSVASASHPAIVIAQVVLAVAYPFLILTGLTRFEPRQLGFLVLAFFALRFGLQRSGRSRAAARALWLPVVTVGLVIGAVLVWNDPLGLLLMPVAISIGFLAAFLGSLRSEQPMVERFARIQVDDLTPPEVEYCRRVTWVWCGFFVLNAGIATTLAAMERRDAWAFYTGFVNYVLMGMLFAAEYVYRHARFRRYLGGFADPLLMHFFQPRRSEASMSPIVENRRREVTGWFVEWWVPEGLDCWPGYFPKQSLLPGILQLEWILREIESELGGRLDVERIDRLKFKQPIFPGDRLTLSVQPESVAPEMDCRIELSVRGEIATSARVHGRMATSSSRRESDGDASVGPAAPTFLEGENLGVASDAHESNAFPAPSLLLPHRAPMLWLDEVIFHEGDETRCIVRAGALPGFTRNTGQADGVEVGPYVALEWMAQCVAAHDGVARHRWGLPIRPGILLGTQRFELSSKNFKQGEAFLVTAVRIFGGDTGMVSYDCSVKEAKSGRSRGSARLSCRIGVPGAPLV